VNQHVEHLRLHGDSFRAAAQLPSVCVKPMIGKDKFHVVALLSAYRAGLKE
jgi:hypothetical protein